MSSAVEERSSKQYSEIPDLGVENGLDSSSLAYATPFRPASLGLKRTPDEDNLLEVLRDEYDSPRPTVRQLGTMRRLDGHARALYRLLTLPIRASLTTAVFTPANDGEEEAEFIETGDTASFNNLKSNFNTFETLIFDAKAGVLSSQEVSAFENGMIPKEFASMTGGNDEASIDMVLQLMGLDKIEQIYHLPSKIKEVKGVEYEMIDDDSVKLRFDMKQLIKTGKVPGYEIRF